MALTDVYVQIYGQLADVFSRLQQGQAPDQFTRQHLVDLGFTSSNHRALIPLLKALGFLTPEGAPTPRYHEYRNKPQARRVMAEALREAYRDLFVLKERPTDADRPLIEGKFRSVHNTSDRVAQLMASTFYSLLELADLDAPDSPKKSPSPEVKNEEPPAKPAHKGEQNRDEHYEERPSRTASRPSLHYNIQIHLPATKDIEVFNAIFKSLKEHLLDR
jgi:hypothetical protein